jgi:fatty-acid desaturase
MSEINCLLFVFFLTLLWNGLGTAIGYHRGLSHRSYTCPKFVEYFFVLGAIFGFQGSPIWWTTIHRAHHRYSDTEFDSHSPRHGFKAWDYRWFLKPSYAEKMDPKQQCPDLFKDPLYRFLEQDGDWVRAQWLNFLGIAVFGRALLIPFFGWKVAAVSLLAGVTFFQMPLLFNYLCHLPKLGYKTYATTDDSVNIWWVGLLWFGEGWHNNHHAFPAAARAGILPHEVDLSWGVLSLLKKVGLVHRLNDVSQAQLDRLEKRYNGSAVIAKSAGSDVEELDESKLIQVGHILEDKRALSLSS